MAEAFAIIGLASALLQFIDFGTKVIRRVRELEDQVADSISLFRGVRNRLPLMLDLVKKIMLQMEAGLVSDKSKETMYPVVHNCIAQAEELDKLLHKVLPSPKDSSWTRGKKAIYGVLSESEIERVDTGLKSNFELLMQAGTFQAIRTQEGSHSISFAPTFTLSPTVQVTLNQQEERHQSLPWEKIDKISDTAQAFFMVPFLRDPNFLGRHDILFKISDAFQKSQFVTLSGLGGIGKSQVAIEYCYIFKEANPNDHVFWIYGADPLHFEQGYQEIARKALVPGWDDQKTDKLKLVQDWLQDEKTIPWLVIVDNADDSAMFYCTRAGDSSRSRSISKAYAHFLPRCSTGRVLITTRDRRLGDRLSQRQGTIEITPLSSERSKDLLRSRISEENWSEDHAMQLVKCLSYLPLAITQAAAFISENSMTVSEYLEMLVNDEKDLKELLSEHLEDPRRDWSSENSVLRTWKLSFDQISKESPRAAEVLSLLAIVNYHGCPWSILRKEGETETGFRTALGVLQAFSLITATRGKNAICKMHRLVAISTQRWLELGGTIQYWQSCALNIVAQAFPGPGQQHFRETSTMLALMPHAEVVLGYEFVSTEDLLTCARLLISTSLFDLSSARYLRAFEKCEQSLKIRESVLPSDDPETLESIQTLGEALLHCGELKTAKTMLQRAIEGREKKLGPLHEDTLESLSDMTITLLELNELDAAEQTGRKALKGREEVLGHKHPDYLVSLNIIGILHHLKGEYDAALEVTERVLRERENLLGYECPDTLMTLNNLARLKYQMGELDAAELMLDKVLAGEQTLLAANGYDIQITLSNRAAVLIARERFKDAEHILQDVLGMRERSLGETHTSTLLTVTALADVIEKQGNLLAATDLRKRVVDADEEQLSTGQTGALLRAGLLFD